MYNRSLKIITNQIWSRNTRSLSHFKKKIAITRDIDESICTAGLTLNPGSQATIDLSLAKKQHYKLHNELIKAGLKVYSIKSDGFPDSVFIEDTAIIIGNKVLITNPGADSRKGETEGVKKFISEKLGDQVTIVDLPNGTVDGGDVLFTGKEIIVGCTSRTNEAGIHSIQAVFPEYPVRMVDIVDLVAYASKTLSLIEDPFMGHDFQSFDVLHLKSFCSMCNEDTILVGGSMGLALKLYLQRNRTVNLSPNTSIASYRFIEVPDMAAANAVYVNNILIRRSKNEYPASDTVFRTQLPVSIKQVEVSSGELAKVDGALTCCSILL